MTAIETEVRYRNGNDIELDEMIELYRASNLGARRPVDERDSMRQMLEHADLVVTAWEGRLLVGIARTLTDFAYVAYLSDLAVRKSHQRRGIGKRLIERTQAELGPGASLVLLAAPAAAEYYPHIGFTQHHGAWLLYPGQRVK